MQVTTLQEGDKQIPVVARLRMNERARLSDIQNLYVYASQDNSKIPLVEISQIDNGMATEALVAHVVISKFCDSLPLYRQEAAVLRGARRDRRPWYIDPTPHYYGYDGDRYYFGRPGFNGGGRYNGGSYGPCWTQIPIGPVWNCV